MATTEHATLTGDDLHEPKGVASANSGDVYVADGAGSGAWTDHLNKYVITGTIVDVSTSATIYLPVPIPGTIIGLYTAIDGALGTDDPDITFAVSAGTVGTVTITQSGSAAGDVDSATSGLSNTTVAAGDYISVATDGASTNTIPCHVAIIIQV